MTPFAKICTANRKAILEALEYASEQNFHIVKIATVVGDCKRASEYVEKGIKFESLRQRLLQASKGK